MPRPCSTRFGSSDPLTLGIEEELLLVDPGSHRLAHVAEEVLGAVELPEALAAHEAFASEIELRTPVCRNVAEAAARARPGARRRARRRRDADGGRPASVGALGRRAADRQASATASSTRRCAA